MPRKTWLKRALGVGALAGAAAFASGCSHSSAAQGTGGAGTADNEYAHRGETSATDLSQQRDVSSLDQQNRECLPKTGRVDLQPPGTGGSGGAVGPEVSSDADPYCLPPNAGVQQHLERMRRTNPEENPKGVTNPNLRPGRPYIEPFGWGPEFDPNKVGGAAGQ